MILTVQLDIKTVEQLAKVFGALKPFLLSSPSATDSENGTPPTENGSSPMVNGDLCPVHQEPLRQFEKHGRRWKAHKHGETWCNGKVK